MKSRTLLWAALALTTFAACSEDDGGQAGSSNIAVFTGTIDGLTATRAYDTTWEEGDEIGIISLSHFNAGVEKELAEENPDYPKTNIPYKTNGYGVFTAADEIISYDDTEPLLFAAYYPYEKDSEDENMPIYIMNSSTIVYLSEYSIVDENGEQPATLQKKIDFLFAKGTGSMANPKVNFEFKHMMSQVQIQFKSEDGSSLEGLSYTIGGISTTGGFDRLTGTMYPYIIKDGDYTSIKVTPEEPTAVSSVLLTPYSEVTSGQLPLSVTIGKYQYSTILNLPDRTKNKLLPGYSIKYVISVHGSSISIGDAIIAPWNYQDGGATLMGVGTANASQATKYALAFADGTFLNIYDSSTAAFKSEYLSEDGNLALSSLTEAQKDACVGIVYWLGNPAKNDKILAKEHEDCTHGLIVGLGEVIYHFYSAYPFWQLSGGGQDKIAVWNKDYFKYDDLGEYDYAEDTGTSYKSVGLANDNTNKLNMILGYNNTKILKDFNYENYYSYTNVIISIAQYLDYYVSYNQAPMNSSGWFIPSPKELVLLTNDTTGSIQFGAQNSQNHVVFDTLNTILLALKDAGVTVGTPYTDFIKMDKLLSRSTDAWYFWSSSEYYISSEKSSFDNYAWYVQVNGGNYGSVLSTAKESGNSAVRFVAAF